MREHVAAVKEEEEKTEKDETRTRRSEEDDCGRHESPDLKYYETVSEVPKEGGQFPEIPKTTKLKTETSKEKTKGTVTQPRCGLTGRS